MVPVMEGWIEQRQANVPAVEKVWLNVAPGLAYKVGVHPDQSEPRA